MLRNQTLFVIGAGASCCYELPTGDELRLAAVKCSAAGAQPVRRAVATAAGVDEHTVIKFLEDLSRSATYSIDEFVESRRDCLEIGRTFIARLLAPRILAAERTINRENRTGSRRKNVDDWTRLLLSEMSLDTSSYSEFASNPVRFIVFNFDKLLEHRIHDQLVSRYQMDSDGANRLIARLPILHVHGTLDGFSVAHCTPKRLKESAPAIRLIHDGADPSINLTIAEWLGESRVVCFLGFSYHPINLTRLTGGRSDAFKNRQLFGTTYGLGAGEVSRVFARLRKRGASPQAAGTVLGDPTHRCEKFLRENTVFR